MTDDSPDVLAAGTGVRRLNKLPILIVVGIGSVVALSLVYAVNQRAKATREAAKPPTDSPLQQHAVVDSAPIIADLTKDVPVAGDVPSAEPDLSFIPAEDSSPAAPASSATTPAATTAAVTIAPQPVANVRPPIDDEATIRRRAAEQRRSQVYDTALAAPTAVNFSTSGSGSQLPVPQLFNSSPASAASSNSDLQAAALRAAAMQAQQTDPNMQDAKDAFLEKVRRPEYLAATRTAPVSRFELKQGTVIPAIMVSGVNSDLPGYLIAQVSQNVYDSATGRHLLVPQGAKLFGRYDSHVSYGQNRVLIAWTRLSYPDGTSLDLAGMPGADQAGYSGFADQVNNHYTKIFGSALMMSAISAGVQISQPDQVTGTQQTAAQEASSAVGQELGRASSAILQKNVNVQPTLEIRPGYRFNVMVSKDVAFAAPYTALR